MSKVRNVVNNGSDSDDNLDDVLGLFSGDTYQARAANDRLKKAQMQRKINKQNEMSEINKKIESRKEYNGKNYYHNPKSQKGLRVDKRTTKDPLYPTLRDGMVPSLPPPPREAYPDFATKTNPFEQGEIEEPFNPRPPPPKLDPESKPTVGAAYGIQVDVPKAPIPTKFVSVGHNGQRNAINPTPYMPYDYQFEQVNQIGPGMNPYNQDFGYVGPPVPVDMIYRPDEKPFYPEGYPLGPFPLGEHPPNIRHGPYQEQYLEPRQDFNTQNKFIPIENGGISISSPNMNFNYQYNVSPQQRLSQVSGITITPREKTWVQPAQMSTGGKTFTATTGTTHLPENVQTSLGMLKIGKTSYNPNQFKLEVPQKGGLDIKIGKQENEPSVDVGKPE